MRREEAEASFTASPTVMQIAIFGGNIVIENCITLLGV